jgi:hypothetical protein
MIFSLLLAGSALAADCLSTLSVVELDDLLERTEAAYMDLDMEAFAELAAEGPLRLPCLDTRLQPDLAARYHRMEAIRRYLDSDKTEAGQALRAAWELEPDYVFPDALLPPGHALRAQFEGMTQEEPDIERAPEPRAGETLFDGIQTDARPLTQATIFQLVDTNAALLETRYLYPSDRLPTYEVSPKRRNRMLLAASGLALSAGGLYAGSFVTRARFDDYDAAYTTDDLSRYRTRTNLLVSASVAFGAGAAGLGTYAFMDPR